MIRIAPDVLEQFVADLVEVRGAPRPIAEDVAASLVAADIRGHGSHGVRNFPGKYDPEIDEGRIDPTAEPIVRDDDSLPTVVDGQRAFGQIVGRRAVDAAVERAAATGIGVVGLKGTSHIGRIGEWVERATDHGMVFIALVCNPGSQLVAPPGSTQRRLSTNPIGIGFPTYDALPFPLVLDMATSQVAYGKIKEWAGKGEAIPDDWAVGADGTKITDPEVVLRDDGAVQPLGGRTTGHKGFGLAVMSELLASMISGGAVSGQDEWGNTAAFIALDPAEFDGRSALEDRIAVFTDYLRDTEFSSAVETGPTTRTGRALLPGEYEHMTARDRHEHGVPLDENVSEAFRDLAREHGVEVPDSMRR